MQHINRADIWRSMRGSCRMAVRQQTPRHAVSFMNKSTTATRPASANDDSMLVLRRNRTFRRSLTKASVMSGIGLRCSCQVGAFPVSLVPQFRNLGSAHHDAGPACLSEVYNLQSIPADGCSDGAACHPWYPCAWSSRRAGSSPIALRRVPQGTR